MSLKEYLLSIIDYDFIRNTHSDMQLASNADIANKIVMSEGIINIIVSNFHCRLITLNEFFDFGVYQSLADPTKTLKPYELLDWYILHDNINPMPVCQAHIDFLKRHPTFNLNVYRMHPDLAQFKPSHLIQHYIKYGKKENRTYC
jgi:hypothetical protein